MVVGSASYRWSPATVHIASRLRWFRKAVVSGGSCRWWSAVVQYGGSRRRFIKVLVNQIRKMRIVLSFIQYGGMFGIQFHSIGKPNV